MRKVKEMKKKKGAASFYIVAFSTLILMVIATSFAMVVISEISRSANDDLSQSAYDSALAGIEDAKVAFSNYRRCKELGVTVDSNYSVNGSLGNITCQDIVYWVEKAPDCYMVGHILGRIGKAETLEVPIGGIIVTNDGKETTTNQAYTCVMIETEMDDYRLVLGSKKPRQTIRLQTGDANTNSVTKVRVSWTLVRHDVPASSYLKFTNSGGFGSVNSGSGAGNPPTVELQLVQTGSTFKLSDFDKTDGGTNRATLYLVPHESNATGKGQYKETSISAGEVVKTNDRMQTNDPKAVTCYPKMDVEFVCSAIIEIPDPIGGKPRNNNSFDITLSLPYYQEEPDVEFSIELICGDSSAKCGEVTLARQAAGSASGERKIKNTQISIDSTGRANDLFRRVETRVETSDATFDFGYPYTPLQVLSTEGVKKQMTVVRELNYPFPAF
ncbi:hypothetical protein IJ076_02675 [Candidatus Saccharibacteria bacterium]|nr:hypothetical protein [Candidatus Saccharibacteria bacterium]